MNVKMKINMAGILLILLVLLAGYFMSSPQKLMLTYISSFGFLALISMVLILAIPILATFKKGDFTESLLLSRGTVGFYAFLFALIHVLLVANFFFNWNVGKMLENPYRTLGAIALLIVALLVSFPRIPSAFFEKYKSVLPYLGIAALTLILVHSIAIGAIFMKNDFVKVAAVLLAGLLIILGLIYRKKG
jgi:DMSO/TMAO reductase YedYZ heme-binding membrane subunit